MRILVTGASGTIGSGVARALLRRDHTVVGVVTGRSAALAPPGVELVTVDLFDPTPLAKISSTVDGAIHAASPNDARAADFDALVVRTLLDLFAGTRRPFVYTSGLGVHGTANGGRFTEDSPFAPPAFLAWRPDIERSLEAAAQQGVHTVRIRPGFVYGRGRGVLAQALAPVDLGGRKVVRHFGDGSNRVATVHADDLGDLYALAVERAPAGSVYLGVNEAAFALRDLAMVIARKHGAAVESWAADDARSYWGPLVDLFLFDQAATSARARTELGWDPHRADVLDDLGL